MNKLSSGRLWRELKEPKGPKTSGLVRGHAGLVNNKLSLRAGLVRGHAGLMHNKLSLSLKRALWHLRSLGPKLSVVFISWEADQV